MIKWLDNTWSCTTGMWVLCTFPCLSVVHIPMFECCTHSHVWVLYTFPCLSVVHIPMFECCTHSHVWVLYIFPCAGARESAFRNIKTIAECLADELINAAKVPCKFTIIDVKPPLCATLHQCAALSCRGVGPTIIQDIATTSVQWTSVE